MGNQITSEVFVGHSIYVNDPVYQNKTGTITSVQDSHHTKITTDIPYISDSELQANFEPYYVNLTGNHYELKVDLYDASDDTIITTTYHSSSPAGVIYYNPAPFLRSRLIAKHNLTGTGTNVLDSNVSIPFYLKYTITYIATDTVVDDSTNVYHAVLAAMQAKDTYGEILGQYTAFEGADLVESKKAKFLTRMGKPCYFPGYPFTLSFAYEGTAKPYREELLRNINEVAVSANSDILTVDNYKYVHQLKLKGSYGASIKSIQVLLSSNGAESGCLALDVTDFAINWILNSNDELQYIEVLLNGTQVTAITSYPNMLLYNGSDVLQETISHGGSGVYTPSSTHTITTGIWYVTLASVGVTMANGEACTISLEDEFDSSLCGIDYDTIGHDLEVY